MRFLEKLDKKYFKISVYVILTVGVAYGLILILGQYKVIGTGLFKAVGWIGNIIKPMLIGAVLAYILYPICRAMEKRIAGTGFGSKDARRNHMIAAVITIIIFIVILVTAISMVAFAITKQITGINGDSVNTLVNSVIEQAKAFEHSFRNWLNDLNIEKGYLLKFEKTLVSKATEILNRTRGLPSMFAGIAAGASTMMFSLLFAVYFLLDGPNLKKYWGSVVRTMWSQKANNRISCIYRDVDEVFSGYFRGEVTDALVMAVLVSIAFTVIGMPYGVMIGVMVGIGNLIPYMGPVVGYGLTLVAGIVTGNIETMIIGLVIIGIIQVVDGAVINPKLLSNSIEIHPMLVILALLAGNKIGGFVGMIGAVPVAALIKLWFERAVEYRKNEKKAAEKQENDGRRKVNSGNGGSYGL